MLIALAQFVITNDYTPAFLVFGGALLFAGVHGRIFKPPV